VLRRTDIRRRGTTPVNTARLRVVLRGVEPAVARVIDVPASATLPELHELLQAAIGWTDSHLHQFVTPQATYGMEIPGAEVWPEDQRDETGALLADLGTEFEYLYDFGDGWTHDIEVLGPGGSAPGCVDGHGACPPEDCGGPGGYAELLDVLADPANPEHEHMRSWVGNRLRPFDCATTDHWVRRVVGEVPESVRLLLDFAADGIKLTPGGRLPRTVVRSMQRGWQRDGQPINEHDVGMAIAQQSPIMKGLDLIDTVNWHVWTAGAAALALLPRATMLAAIWTNDE
jgi:pRiA4b ORF-3-like protein